MTDRLENLISDVLQGKATEAANGAGLESSASRRGRRLVLRRRITAGVACVAALAVGIPSGAWLFGTAGDREIAPAGSIYGPAVRPSLPAKLTKVTIDLGKLKQGEPPAVPYFVRGLLYDGERRIELTRPTDDAMFTPVQGGYLVQVTNNDADVPDDEFNRVMLVDAAGNKVRDLPLLNEHAPRALPAVSADGRKIAWPEWTSDGQDSELVVADSATGKVVARKVITEVPFPYPVGFSGEQVVFAAGLPAEGETGVEKFEVAVKRLGAGVTNIWDPVSGKVSALDYRAGTARGADDFEHILTGTNPAQNCLAGYSADDRKRLWRTCGIEFSELSRAGLVIGEVAGRTADESRTVILDAASGRRLLEIDGSVEGVVWERDNELLLVATDRTGSAIVRCSLTGQCERATEYLPESTGGPVRLPDKP